MCVFQRVLTVDLTLGRVDYSLLSDQTLMEILIEGIDDQTKKQYQDKHGMYLDVCEWSCIECDDDERVVEIGLGFGRISGSIQLRYVPPKVKILKMSSPWMGGELTGPVDLAHLPDGMQQLYLENNQLTGEIDLTQLLGEMEYLYLQNNQFTGEIDLTRLPDGMVRLYLENNNLAGEVDLTHLPNAMEQLYLTDNQLTGEIDLTHLPDRMHVLHLENNLLSGSFFIKSQTSRVCINAQQNNFNAVAVVHAETLSRIFLRGSGVTSVVDENGKELDMKQFV